MMIFFSVKQRSINGENVHVNMLDDEMQGFVLPLLNSNQVVHIGSGVDHSLGRYNCMDIVILKVCHDEYIFGEIKKLFFINGSVYLYCQELVVLEYSAQFHAYSVLNADTFILIKIEDLLDYHVLGRYAVANASYVPLKHFVMKF